MQRIPDASSFEERIGIRITIKNQENIPRSTPIWMTKNRTIFQENLIKIYQHKYVEKKQFYATNS